MFFIAKDASEGIFGLCFIICNAKSLIESIIALNSLSVLSGIISGTPCIIAFKYGLSDITFSTTNI
jgi:hypothetical protein